MIPLHSHRKQERDCGKDLYKQRAGECCIEKLKHFDANFACLTVKTQAKHVTLKPSSDNSRLSLL